MWMMLVVIGVLCAVVLTLVVVQWLAMRAVGAAMVDAVQTNNELMSQFAFQVMTPREQQLDLAQATLADEQPMNGWRPRPTIEPIPDPSLDL